MKPMCENMNLLIIFLLFLKYCESSPWDKLTANIAVVEYHPSLDPSLSTKDKITLNTKRYIKIINETTSNQKLDMIIFPEDTLRNNPKTAVEIAKDTPCDSKTYPQFLKDLSCAARESQTYLVVNLVEKSKCDQRIDPKRNCKEFGFDFYNTDLIFDRKGKIINRYRKYNLFGEWQLDRPEAPEEVVFSTDFGIRFGIFTCFDILFKSPAQDLLEEDVDGVIFPSMWYSELPFLTALQVQQMWGYTHDVVLFGAGANKPDGGTGGSGIYRGSKGTILEGIVTKGDYQTLIYRSTSGEVPPPPPQNVDVLAKQMDDFKLFMDSSIPEYNFTVLDSSRPHFETEICHGKKESRLCCNFNLKMSKKEATSKKDSYTYLLVAFSGVRSFHGAYNGGTEICAVISCVYSSISSCGRRFPHYEDIYWPLTFEEITIKANFENDSNKTQFPNSLLSSIRPIDAKETSWEGIEIKENGREYIQRIFSLRKPQNRLLTFGIYGRDFGRDSPPKESSSGKRVVTWALVGCVLGLFTFNFVTV